MDVQAEAAHAVKILWNADAQTCDGWGVVKALEDPQQFVTNAPSHRLWEDGDLCVHPQHHLRMEKPDSVHGEWADSFPNFFHHMFRTLACETI